MDYKLDGHHHSMTTQRAFLLGREESLTTPPLRKVKLPITTKDSYHPFPKSFNNRSSRFSSGHSKGPSSEYYLASSQRSSSSSTSCSEVCSKCSKSCVKTITSTNTYHRLPQRLHSPRRRNSPRNSFLWNPALIGSYIIMLFCLHLTNGEPQHAGDRWNKAQPWSYDVIKNLIPDAKENSSFPFKVRNLLALTR